MNETGMYEYVTPPGQGDVWFQYVLDAQSLGLVDARDYLQSQGVIVTDGAFMLRHWAGIKTMADRLNIYDQDSRRMYAQAAWLGTNANGIPFGQSVVAPEWAYRVNSKIKVDLINVQQTLIGTDSGTNIYASQLVFSGVRRIPLAVSDPIPSAYKYYEKPYQIPYALSIANYATTGGVFNPSIQIQIPVLDFDFELRRIEMELNDVQTPMFKMLLYDSNKVARASAPVLANMVCHTDPASLFGSGESSFWPCPPILYRVNSSIIFDVSSLLVSPTALPQTVRLMFNGVRRIPCQ